MTQRTIDVLINEICSKGPQKNYITNKTSVYHIDEIWNCEVLDLKEYGPERNGGYRHASVVIDKFSHCGWTVPLKNKTAQTKTNSSGNNFNSSKRKPVLIEIDRGKEFVNKFFNLLNNNKTQRYARKTSLGADFAERFSRTSRDVKRPVF